MTYKDFGQDDEPNNEAQQVHDVKALAKGHSKIAMDTLAEICKDKEASASARGFAAVALLDRGWGKPSSDDDAGPDKYKRMSLQDLLELRDAVLLAAQHRQTSDPRPMIEGSARLIDEPQ